MASIKSKKGFIVTLSIFLLTMLSLTSLYNNDFKVDTRLIVSTLVGWAIGTVVLILLVKLIKPSKKKS